MPQASKDKNNGGSSQLFTFLRDSYMDRSSRPICAVWFLLPLLVLYEIGTVFISPEALSQSLQESQIRVISFVWIQNLLEYLGFPGRFAWFATPLVVIVILLALQITSRRSWRVRMGDFFPMAMECVILAIPLIVLSLLLNRPIEMEQQAQTGGSVIQAACFLLGSGYSSGQALWVDIVTGIGAGIYEELVFRLILISLLMMLFQDILALHRSRAIFLSILVSAALFSAHHHLYIVNGQIGLGEAFSVLRFTFRTLAGGYFAVIFAVRGFGIVAGAHAAYDIIAAVLNFMLFAG